MFDKINYLRRAMDASWLKQEAISNNMANANTPGYKRQTVEFENVLRDYTEQRAAGTAMVKTNARHMDIYGDLEPTVKTVTDTAFRKDENNVNVDVEMAEEAKNTIKYNFLSTQISDEFKRLRLAIRDGR